MITVIKKPHRFTPVENPIIFQVESNNADTIYFRIEILEAVSNSVINFLDCYTTPDYADGTHVNLSRILSNYVKWQIESNVARPFFPCPNEVVKYKLKITERGYVSGLMADLSSYTTTDDFYAWYATFDKFSFNLGGYKDYVLTDAALNKYLTHKPNAVYVNEFSFEQLFFINDSSSTLLTVKIDIYSPNGSFFVTRSFNITPIDALNAINVSPKTLVAWHGVNMSSIGSYTVEILDGSTKISETRRYIFKRNECHLEPVNLIWSNPLGGIDSYQFVQPQNSLSVSRGIIKKNSFKMDDGIYSDMTGDIYNVVDEIYSSVPTVTVKLWTKVLTDNEVAWLGEMVNSKQLFVELTDNTLVPVNLVNTNYNYQRKRYLENAVNVMQFEFTFSQNVMPVLSNASYIQNSIYYNAERSGAFQKSDCPTLSVGSTELYIVPAGTYSSLISQTDADAQADADIVANGQNYANTIGSCDSSGVFGNEVLTVEKRKQCHAGYYGSLEEYTVPANTYFAYSQAGANALAQADANSNAQTHANTVGSCIAGYGNEEISNIVQKNDCTPPQVGTFVTYTLGANIFFADTQAEADSIAEEYAGFNQQTYANSNGTCVDPPYSITLVAKTAVSTVGDVDKVVCWVEASQPILDNLTITIQAQDTTLGTEIGSGATIYMSTGMVNSGITPVGDFGAGYGVNIQAFILSVSVPPTTTMYIY